jgi:hypothetical protein
MIDIEGILYRNHMRHVIKDTLTSWLPASTIDVYASPMSDPLPRFDILVIDPEIGCDDDAIAVAAVRQILAGSQFRSCNLDVQVHWSSTSPVLARRVG